MATSFLEIYTRSMSMLKSPSLSRLQLTNLQSFSIIMGQYLATGTTFYNPNKATFTRISDISADEYGLQGFVGDGATTSFILTSLTPTTKDIAFTVQVNNVVVSNYVYNAVANSINFTTAPILNAVINITWNIIGTFNGAITAEDITLLSMVTCLAWALQIQNDELDIDRSLNDTGDFKQHANATTTTAKFNWVKHFEEMYKRIVTPADWRSTLFRR